MDPEARPGTVTCGDGRGWTVCLLFASRGSGVRVPLVLPGQKQNSNSWASEYSSKTSQPGRARCRTGAAHAFGLAWSSRPAAHGSQVLGARVRTAEQEERLRELAPLARRPVGSVLNLLVSRLTSAAQAEDQRMTNYSITQGEIPRDALQVHCCISPTTSAMRSCRMGAVRCAD
jgi:hypothetical protein